MPLGGADFQAGHVGILADVVPQAFLPVFFRATRDLILGCSNYL
jgi:hypothetical protein